MENITYIFAKDRKKHLEENKIQANEFYYGFKYFEKEKYNLNVIEFDDRVSILNYFWLILDVILRRFISLPFYTSKLFRFKNLKNLYKTDHLIMVNESVGCSALFMIIIIRRIKRLKCHLFVMGLYSKKIKFPKLKRLHFFVINILVKNLDNLFFLGKEEMKIAKKVHKKYEYKFHYFPFSIDTEFWRTDNIDSSKKEQIIFVGNDGNRDAKLLVNIAKNIPDKDFLFISEIPYLQNLNVENIKILKGKWGSTEISDEKLKKHYENSRLCILPLKESSQPSGQSVSLQCMSLGIPVMISKTKGFWDYDVFKHKENILFTNNDLRSWVDNINLFYKNTKLLDLISKNAKATVVNKYNLKIFFDFLINKISS